jgi:hypothetical protein
LNDLVSIDDINEPLSFSDNYFFAAVLYHLIVVFARVGAAAFAAFNKNDAKTAVQKHTGEISLFIGLAYFSIFESYRKENCNNQVFNASFLIVLAALFVPPLIFLLPLFWLAFNIVNTMNFKRWLVSLMGALTVFWLLGGVLFLSDRLELIPAFFKACIQYGWVFSTELPTMGIVFFSMLFLLVMLAIVNYLRQVYSEKIGVRSAFSFLLISLLVFVVSMVIFPAYTVDFFLLSIGPASVMLSHYYGSEVNLFGRLALYVFLLTAVGNYLSFFFSF